MVGSQRAYARHRGVTHRAVRVAVASGRISTMPGGKIDFEKADKEWAENTNGMLPGHGDLRCSGGHECVLAHPELQRFRRWVLVTRDAHGLHRQFGFAELRSPDRYMEIRIPDPYQGEEKSRR